ncbi:hypothetical protein [Vibrio breoganii]|uniref:hypothetical protein n=1 Tax=Vibrio breoganii TaxID=553239 RepID=UPI0010566B54|nr:hypothetical protein [Vibrio breoganii]
MLIIFYIRIIFVGLLIVSLALLDIPKFVYVLDRFLFISAFFLYLQFSLSASGVGFINFHNIFFPWSNNYEIVSFGITRMNSFYMEPGAYGNIVGLLTALSLILHNKIKKRHVFYSFSIIMSFALSSFFFFILLVILSCCFVKRKNLIKSFIASVFLSSIVVFIALETGVFDYGYERLSNIESNGSANVKVDNFDAWKNYSLERKLFGQSIFVNSDVESVNSNGFLFYSLYYWGVIGLLLSFMPFLISVIRMNAKLAIFCVMLYASRYSFNYPTGIFLVYFIIGLLYLRNETNLLSTEQREHLQ